MTDPGAFSDVSARALLDAVRAISGDLDLHSVLERIVDAARTLTGAQYGALGVLSDQGDLADFVALGIGPELRAKIGDLPRGRGVLGVLLRDPSPIRLDDIAAHADSFGFPANHPPMHSFLGVPVRVRGSVFGNLYLTEKEGGARFTGEDESLVGALADAAGFVIDNARAYGLSERRRQWLEASAELSAALQPPLDSSEATARIARKARAVTRAEVVLVLQDSGAGTLEVQARSGGIPAPDDSLSKAVIEAADAAAKVAASVIDLPDGRRALAVPLNAHLAAAGLLVAVFADRRHGPAGEDRELLASFADQAALALDRVHAYGVGQQLALLSDRERIARDLHDVVIQRLFATGLQVERVRSVTTSPEERDRLDGAVHALDDTIRDIRSTIFDLEAPRPHGLRASLHALVSEYSGHFGRTIHLDVQGAVDSGVRDEVRTNLLVVLREALSNATRHADANRIAVSVSATSSGVILRVTDDGVGLPEDRVESGLRNAAKRAEELGGVLELEKAEPSGTAVVWTVPL